MEELNRIIEALLFASPDPLSVGRIKAIIPGLENQQVLQALEELREEYSADSRSFQIVEIGGGYQITTKPDYALWVGKLFETRAKQRLSKAALETLAVVAYRQPALRSTIESVRGVNVDGVLHTLMERDLVRIVGRAEGPGRPLLFGTTREFLMRFGLSNLSDLPKMEEIEDLIGRRNADEQDEAESDGAGEAAWAPTAGEDGMGEAREVAGSDDDTEDEDQ